MISNVIRRTHLELRLVQHGTSTVQDIVFATRIAQLVVSTYRARPALWRPRKPAFLVGRALQ
jgi:hypothetical protein